MPETLDEISREEEKSRFNLGAITAGVGLAALIGANVIPRHYRPLEELDIALAVSGSLVSLKGIIDMVHAMRRTQLLDYREADEEYIEQEQVSDPTEQ